MSIRLRQIAAAIYLVAPGHDAWHGVCDQEKMWLDVAWQYAT
jgi:hypothetical protein